MKIVNKVHKANIHWEPRLTQTVVEVFVEYLDGSIHCTGPVPHLCCCDFAVDDSSCCMDTSNRQGCQL